MQKNFVDLFNSPCTSNTLYTVRDWATRKLSMLAACTRSLVKRHKPEHAIQAR